MRPSRRGRIGPDQALVSEPLPHDVSQHVDEAKRIGRLPGVEPEGLFVEVAEQMERLDADVGALDRPLEQRPEVFESVSVWMRPST